MKINDLFKEDLLNSKPILINEYGVTIEKKTSNNFEILLLALLFGLTTILITTKYKYNERTTKEN